MFYCCEDEMPRASIVSRLVLSRTTIKKKYREVIFKEKKFFIENVATVMEPHYEAVPVIIMSAYLILS